MKNILSLSGVVAISVLISCSNETKKEEQTTPPPAPVTQPVTPPPAEQKEGTTIKINDKGVSVESKDGSKKNNVSISQDSSSIQLSNPK